MRNKSQATQKNRRTALVYDYFAHYREGVLKELSKSPVHDYIFVSDRRDVTGKVKAWNFPPSFPWVEARCRRLALDILLQQGLIRLALRHDLDAIIYLGNAHWPSTWISAILARLSGKRVLFWTIGWIKPDRGLKRLVRKAFYKLPHGLLLYGHRAKMIAINEGFAPEKLYVIYNSLDYQEQKNAREQVTAETIVNTRREFFLDPAVPMIVFAGRLVAKPKIHMLLQALASLKKANHPVNLLLIGDGPERSKLEVLATQLDVSVYFYGACYNYAKLAALIMAANATVSPGSIGLVAMQSLAFGTPVLTNGDYSSQGPEWEALIQGINADFFECDDIAEMARIIKKWTEAPYPNEQRRKSCYRIIERFYNPVFQRIAIDRAVAGKPADDLFWVRENFSDLQDLADRVTPIDLPRH